MRQKRPLSGVRKVTTVASGQTSQTIQMGCSSSQLQHPGTRPIGSGSLLALVTDQRLSLRVRCTFDWTLNICTGMDRMLGTCSVRL